MPRVVVLGVRALIAAVAVVVLAAAPAAAHGGVTDATNWRSRVLDGGAPGLRWTVLGGDALLQLENTTAAEVVVQGYDGEPYLRFVPGDGVFENRRSAAVYLNRDRFGALDVPDIVDPAAEPDWSRVASGATHRWHDHRTHWMAEQLPPAVEADRSEARQMLDWRIPLLVDGVAHQASGDLWWIPGTSGVRYVAVSAGVAVAALAAAALTSRPTARHWHRPARVLWAMTALVWVVDVVRTVDHVVAVRVAFVEQLSFLIVAAITIVAIALLLRRGWRGDMGAFFALAGAGFLLMASFAAEQSDQLSASQITTVLPLWVRRWSIAASWAICLPAFGALVLAMWRLTDGTILARRVVSTSGATEGSANPSRG